MIARLLSFPAPMAFAIFSVLTQATRAGHKQLQTKTRDREQTAGVIARFFEVKREDLS
jgi:hypothetical protein